MKAPTSTPGRKDAKVPSPLPSEFIANRDRAHADLCRAIAASHRLEQVKLLLVPTCPVCQGAKVVRCDQIIPGLYKDCPACAKPS